MFTIIRKKTLEKLKNEKDGLSRMLNQTMKDSREKSIRIGGLEGNIDNLKWQINNLEKKVKEQREVIANMMILLDFFSQKILKQKKDNQGFPTPYLFKATGWV